MKSSYILGLCYGGMVCVAIGVNLLPVYFTTFAAVFGGLNEEQLGRIPAVMFAGVVVGIMLSGPLADRFGARLFTVSGMAVAALGLLLMSVANGYGALLAAGAVSGLGAGILDMVMSPIVSAVCTDRRGAQPAPRVLLYRRHRHGVGCGGGQYRLSGHTVDDWPGGGAHRPAYRHSGGEFRACSTGACCGNPMGR